MNILNSKKVTYENEIEIPTILENENENEIKEEIKNEIKEEESKEEEVKEEIKENNNNNKYNLFDWSDINISNDTKDILLDENDWKNCYDFYGIEYYKALLNLYKTGNIIYNGKELIFNSENYIDTTYFDRSNINNQNILIAGDIITFRTLNFDIGIFINEVELNNKITSKIITDIYNKPKTTIIATNDMIFSTSKDTLGNCYVLKYDYNKEFINKIYPFIENNNFIIPSNKSNYLYSINNNSNYSSFKLTNNYFINNKLIYNNNFRLPKLNNFIENSNDVIIPNFNEFAKKNNEEIIKPFNCNIKGFLSIHRSKENLNEPFIQCMNFEINFFNNIKLYDLNSFNIFEMPFLNYNESNNIIKFIKDLNNKSCFFSGDGFYINNINKNFNLIENDLNIKNFSIHSPIFFTNVQQNNQIIKYKKKINSNINNNNKIINDYINLENKNLKSLHIMENCQQNNNCNIV